MSFLQRNTPYISVVVAMLLRTLNNRDERMEFVRQLTAAHQENAGGDRGNIFLDSLSPTMRAKVEPELTKIDEAWRGQHKGRDTGGYVNFFSADESHGHIQTLLGKADHIVSGMEFDRLPDVRRKRILEQITRELEERNSDEPLSRA